MSSESGPSPVHAESMAAKVSPGVDPEGRLRRAFADDEFMLLGQSIVPLNVAKHLPFRMELLVRLRKNEVDMLPPRVFFPAAQVFDMMPMLDRWVVARAGGWRRDVNGAGNMVLHINLAPQSLEEHTFTDYVLKHMHKCRIPAAAFCFELPLTDVASASAHYLASVGRLKGAGCDLAIAGFRCDSVSLEALRATGAAVIKVDSPMAQAVAEDAEACSRLRFLHRLCKKAGVITVAESVERGETLSTLRDIGVDYAQGYGIARPERLLENRWRNDAVGVKTLPLRRPAQLVLA